MIARHFNQITELGKMLDPLADKLTQGTVAICIAVHYPSDWPLLALLVLKELVMLCGACYLLKNGKKAVRGKVVRQGLHNTVLYRHRTHRRHGRLYEVSESHVQYRVHHGARHHGGLHGVHVHSIFRRVRAKF